MWPFIQPPHTLSALQAVRGLDDQLDELRLPLAAQARVLQKSVARLEAAAAHAASVHAGGTLARHSGGSSAGRAGSAFEPVSAFVTAARELQGVLKAGQAAVEGVGAGVGQLGESHPNNGNHSLRAAKWFMSLRVAPKQSHRERASGGDRQHDEPVAMGGRAAVGGAVAPGRGSRAVADTAAAAAGQAAGKGAAAERMSQLGVGVMRRKGCLTSTLAPGRVGSSRGVAGLSEGSRQEAVTCQHPTTTRAWASASRQRLGCKGVDYDRSPHSDVRAVGSGACDESSDDDSGSWLLTSERGCVRHDSSEVVGAHAEVCQRYKRTQGGSHFGQCAAGFEEGKGGGCNGEEARQLAEAYRRLQAVRRASEAASSRLVNHQPTLVKFAEQPGGPGHASKSYWKEAPRLEEHARRD